MPRTPCATALQAGLCAGVAAVVLATAAVGPSRAELPTPPRHIIFFIADGCGPRHVDAASLYAYGETGRQVYERFPFVFTMSTYSASENGYEPLRLARDFEYPMVLATNSAAAATAMSTGMKTYYEAVGVGLDHEPLEHLVERLKQHGLATGVVTSVQFCHGTPGGFVAHNPSRDNYVEIAQEMLLDSRLDLIIGCGHPWFDNAGALLATPAYTYVGGERCWNGLVAGQTEFDLDGDGQIDNVLEDCDGDDLPDPWSLCHSREVFQALSSGETPHRVLGIPRVSQTLQFKRGGDPEADPYVVPLTASVPTLAELTRAALNVLDNDPDGFFVMIEGGAIDWASHQNCTGRMIEEQIGFNDAVAAAVEWVNENSNWSDALLVVTADHECGYLLGPGSGGAPPVWNPPVNNGAGQVPGLTWYHDSHTNLLVPFYAQGASARWLADQADEHDPSRGAFINNTEVAQLLFDLYPLPGEIVWPPQNIVLLVADGVGEHHLLASGYYTHGAAGLLPYEDFPFQAPMTTYSASGDGFAHVSARNQFDYILAHASDAAAAATALSTGRKAPDGSLGRGPEGAPLAHLTQIAEALGKATGLVASVPFGAGCPAGFAAHQEDAADTVAIAQELLLDTRLDLLMGCGHPWYDDLGDSLAVARSYAPVGGEACWQGLCQGLIDFDLDGDQIPDNSVEDCDGDGIPDPWSLIHSREAFQALAQGSVPARILGLPRVGATLQFGRGGDLLAPPYAVPLNAGVPTLAEMTAGALCALERDPDGFLLVVVGGATDGASRAHATGRLLEELDDFNAAADSVIAWVEAHGGWDETLVIVTSTHETGYLTGPGSGVGYPPAVNPPTNLGAGVVPEIEWHSDGPTNALVPCFACGPGTDLLARCVDDYSLVAGYYLSNTEPAQVCRWLWQEQAGAAGVAYAPAAPATPAWTIGGDLPAPIFHPNPCRPGTRVLFRLPEAGEVSLSLYDLLGRRIATLVDSYHAAGIHSVEGETRRLPAGVYFARLRFGSRQAVGRLTVIR